MSLNFDDEPTSYRFRPVHLGSFDGWPAAVEPTDEERRVVLCVADRLPEVMQAPVFVREECEHQRLNISPAAIRGALEGLGT